MTITLTNFSINPIASATYLTSFNPGNIATNYLGDSGNSTIQTGSSVSYSVTIPAFTAFDVIVNEVNSEGHPAEYGLTVVGPGGIVQVPESSRGILIVSVVFIGLVMASRRFGPVSRALAR